MKLAKGIAGAAMLILSSSAYADTFEYRIRSIAPNTTDTNCYELIEAISEDFATSAGVEVASHGCYVGRFNDNRLDGLITYEADERIKITSYLEYGNFGIEETALYSDEETCLADLERQKELFSTETGLTPHAAYCYPKNTSFDNNHYLQIEAAGEADREHFFTGVDLYGQPSRGYEAYWTELSTNLLNYGLVLSKAAFVPKVFYYRVTIGHYADQRMYIEHNGEVRVESPEACGMVEERAKISFGELDRPPLLIFCDKDGNGLWGNRLNIYTLETSIMEPSDYEHRILPGYYESIELCREGRDDAVERLRLRGVEVIDAFCGSDSRRRIILNGFIRK